MFFRLLIHARQLHGQREVNSARNRSRNTTVLASSQIMCCWRCLLLLFVMRRAQLPAPSSCLSFVVGWAVAVEILCVAIGGKACLFCNRVTEEVSRLFGARGNALMRLCVFTLHGSIYQPLMAGNIGEDFSLGQYFRYLGDAPKSVGVFFFLYKALVVIYSVISNTKGTRCLTTPGASQNSVQEPEYTAVEPSTDGCGEVEKTREHSFYRSTAESTPA